MNDALCTFIRDALTYFRGRNTFIPFFDLEGTMQLICCLAFTFPSFQACKIDIFQYLKLYRNRFNHLVYTQSDHNFRIFSSILFDCFKSRFNCWTKLIVVYIQIKSIKRYNWDISMDSSRFFSVVLRSKGRRKLFIEFCNTSSSNSKADWIRPLFIIRHQMFRSSYEITFNSNEICWLLPDPLTKKIVSIIWFVS